MAGVARTSADCPRGGQPDLAAPFRYGTGQDGRELRRPGRTAVASRALRLAGIRAGAIRLGHKSAASADRHERDVPAGVACDTGLDGPRSRKSPAGAGRGSGCQPRSCATTPWPSPGLLVREIGGPSVKPYQPAGLWEELAGGAARGPTCRIKEPGSIAAVCTSTASGPSPTRCWRPSTPPAARPARSSAHVPTHRSRRRAVERRDLRRSRPPARRAGTRARRLEPRGTDCLRIPRAHLAAPAPRSSSCSGGGSSVTSSPIAATWSCPPVDPARRKLAGRADLTLLCWPPTRRRPASSSTSTRRSRVNNSSGAWTLRRTDWSIRPTGEGPGNGPTETCATAQSPDLSLARSGAGLGAFALHSLLERDATPRRRRVASTDGAHWCERGRRLAGAAAFPAQGQASDLSVPVGRAVADGPVRLQAGDCGEARHRAARVGANGPADHDHDLGAKEPAGRSLDLQVRPARPERRVGQRALAAHRSDRRRHLPDPFHADRGDQSRPGDHLRADRLAARGPARAWGRGSPTG